MAALTGLKRQTQLRTLLAATNSKRRPLLTHLSADNSWLLSIPIPDDTPAATSHGTTQRHPKVYFHLLLDAWLTPSNFPFPGARWFQEQYHIENPACQSIAAVIELISDIEVAASNNTILVGESKAGIDAVVVGHNLSDHMNYDTLRQVDTSVPVFAADTAFPTVLSWKHFDSVVQIPGLGANSESVDWRTDSSVHLPPWIAIWRIPGPKTPPYLHWGICIIFKPDETGLECMVQSPHGLYVEDAAVLKKISPSVKTLALLHTTNQSWFWGWGTANLGARNGAQVAEAIEARYCKLTPFFLHT